MLQLTGSIANRLIPTNQPRLFGKLTIGVVVLMLMAHLVLAAGSVRHKSNTFDELIHLTAGYSYWKYNDYRMHPENGNLAQRWAALPLLLQSVNFPGFDENSNIYEVAHEFFFRLGNDANAMLFRGRMMIVGLSLLLGLGVYFWSARVFGPLGGLISLALYCLSPTILANARLTTSDLPAALFFLFAVGAIWRLLHRMTVGTVAVAAVAVSGLLLSKMSGVLIIPVSILMVLFRILWGGDQPMALGKMKRIQTRTSQAGVTVCVALLVAIVTLALIWGAYGFRYSAGPEPLLGQESSFPDWTEQLTRAGYLQGPISFLRDSRLLPEAYLYGFTYVLSYSKARSAFLAGRYSETGWWYFFPFSFLVKTPLSTLLVAALALLALVRVSRWRNVYPLSPLLFFAAVYGVVAVTAHVNIGHRHILPMYPVLFILSGAAACWLTVSKRVFLALSPLIAAVLIFETQSIWPHYLAFFNAAAGGPQNGYRLLVDSSLDWGQDLRGLVRWIDMRRAGGEGRRTFYFAYFGTASPVYYKVRAKMIGTQPLPWAKDVNHWALSLGPGYYCISATDLQQVYGLRNGWLVEYEKAYQASRKVINEFHKRAGEPETPQRLTIDTGGEENPDHVMAQYRKLQFARLCAVLRKRNPETAIGYSILIYLVSRTELDRALNGTPEGL